MDLTPVWLSLKLALTSVALLLALATPLAWWLAHTRSRLRVLVEAIVALPLVLPPTVLGFYLLILLGPHGPVGAPWVRITGNSLTFSFLGLVVSSVLYSLPFAVQPIHASLEAVGRGPLEAAWTLRASPLDAFWSVGLPMAFRGFLTAAVLAFAHTLGEFGVVLMVGGNIPGQTRVLSIAIYEEVETLNYATAHALSLGLLAFSFCALLLVYGINR
ncbi:MAG TPA: molybdate ABC transporter permease subunit, partial [bacterium]|nr:molybdate ABC transporter permease subunit [bacterium]